MAESWAALRVLIVDDNVAMHQIISAVLGSLGVRDVRHAQDGASALAALRSAPVDLVFADYLMRPMDGVAFTRALRTDPNSPDPYLPVIMATGYADRARVVEARDAGVTELLVKPLTAQGIMERLDAVVSRPRPFVSSADYFGPDRRRRPLQDYAGPWRRAGDAALLDGAAPSPRLSGRA